ncbi:hypothetical protein L210DRAFT_3643975 [Boletus edulis BED1]|uniref:Rho termination factor N-terminal domain-containing protein n=1 Tax=Boletus edulis BED1 TaxID=1328754 RepID=A0AAD4BYF3_BOLED|nr:hypothetical protein L210DRAFT_3643975 [Boletus edulis BED1]
MASSGPSVPSDLSKLTVPQLKALCKERRITGYSKLSKAALSTAVPSADEVRNPANTTACIGSSNVCPAANATNATHQPVQPTSTGNTNPTETRSTAKDPYPPNFPNGCRTTPLQALRRQALRKPPARKGLRI